MADRSLKRRAIADKLSADIARLEKEIVDRRKHLVEARERLVARRVARAYIGGAAQVDASGFAAWSRHVPAIARAVGQLERLRRRLPAALEKADSAAMLAREERERRARINAANEGLMRRLDALAAAAPTIDARWAQERLQEAKRIKALQKKLARRAAKRAPERPDWMRKPVKLPAPIRQPDLTIETEKGDDTALVERPGLLPGTYTVMDPRRLRKLLDRPSTPKVWTATYTGARLIEAHRVLMKTPAAIYPKGYGAAWPLYKAEASEAAGPGLRQPIRFAPSADAVARCSEAIAWPMQFLSNRPDLAADVNWWALEAAWDQLEFDSRSAPWEALQIIATALNAAKEPVT